jgi:putative sigma-54 modulation protein
VDVTVSSRNVELSAALRALTEEKIGRLGRFLDGIERAEVHFYEERNRRIVDKDVCEVTVEGHGHHVRARVAAPDTFAAVDAAVAKLEHQLHKLKTKLVGRSHPRRRAAVNGAAARTARLQPGQDDEGDVQEDGPGVTADGAIVRTKRFDLRPMTPGEAVSQMELLGHGFFLFAHADTGQAAVVYRRTAGGVGLIEQA